MPICNNCENYGHLFYNCKRPITSLGLICYRINPLNNNYEYLLIQRKDSLGYVDFLRGKYNENNEFHLNNLFSEMTDNEIDNILNKSYDRLWNELWNKQHEPFDIKPKDKMLYVIQNKHHLIIKKGWKLPEWGYPKGRRNYKETDLECALREFKEETGYNTTNIKIIRNILPIEEVFTGSNLKSYKHKYFIGYMEYNDTLYDAQFQKSEIGNMKWCSYIDCLNTIRYYNTEKIEVINYVNSIINNNRIY